MLSYLFAQFQTYLPTKLNNLTSDINYAIKTSETKRAVRSYSFNNYEKNIIAKHVLGL